MQAEISIRIHKLEMQLFDTAISPCYTCTRTDDTTGGPAPAARKTRGGVVHCQGAHQNRASGRPQNGSTGLPAVNSPLPVISATTASCIASSVQ